LRQDTPGARGIAASGRAEALERLLGEVRARRRAFAERKRLDGDIVDLMKRAGVFRMLVGRRFGGDEATPSEFFRLVERIASADGSSGWVASFGHAAIYLSALPVATLEEIYAHGPDIIFAGGIFPPKPAVPTDGGFKVDGTWSWASGSTAANLIGVGISVAGGSDASGLPCMAVIPKEQVSIVDNWDVNGLQGTGSHDVVVRGIVVPEAWTFLRGAPSSLDGPLFRYPTLALAAQALAVVGLGTARAALDEVKAMAASRASITGAPPMRERAYVQADLAKAEAMLRAARAFFYEATDSAYDALVRGDTLGSDVHTLLRLSATHAAKTGSEVARIAYSISGTAGIFTDHPLAQALQDSLVVTQHVFLAEGTWQSAGRMLLGFPAGPAFP
jgi:indole-3-acetate monooxygenase